MVTTLILARHGETDWNREHRLQGWEDPPLNALGRAQAVALAESLRGEPIGRVVTSDLRRAAETADVVGALLSVPVSVEWGLREVDLGSWSGRLRTEIEGRPRPDGESREELRVRMVDAIERIAACRPGETVLVVSHGGSLRSIELHVAGGDPRPLANCETIRLEARDGTLSLVRAAPLVPPLPLEADDAEMLDQG
ncbi:MAG: histidine phosphatase family protein [Thermoleophilia bacterium]|nr:histidine phosphatase family protein [Thermoleophilia bacterium]